jgi:hypothetical protein
MIEADADAVLSQTLMRVLLAFGPASLFTLARLAGRSEIEIAAALDGLMRDGLAEASGDLWTLTAKGVEVLRPAHQSRPPSAVRMKMGRPPSRTG